MRKSKFWIWFIPLFALACIGMYNLVSMASKKEAVQQQEKSSEKNKDALVIKKEYEDLNEDLIKVNLSESNLYFYADEEAINKLFEGNGILYFGNPKSNASRKNIALLDEVVSSTSINKVYYLDITKLNDGYLNNLKEKLKTKTINAGEAYLIKMGEVIDTIKVDKFDNSRELTDKEKENIQLDYLEKINDLIEKCDESC